MIFPKGVSARFGAALGGFSLIEILVVLFVISILVGLSGLAYKPLIARAENAKCLANMHSLHMALSAYIQDKATWPQEPPELWDKGDNEALEDWWIAALKPYGSTIETWRCPTIFRALQKSDPNQRPKAHYTPSKFDPGAMAPYKYPQPWLIEIGNMHGHGANICFPDGSIRTMNDVVGPM